MAEASMRLARVLDGLGRPGRELGVRADLLRATGARGAVGRLQDEARARRHRVDPAVDAYPALWRDAAARAGAQLRALGSGFLEISRGSRRVVVRDQWVPLDTAVALELSFDKRIVTGMLRDLGLPVTDQLEYRLRRPQPAIDFLAESTAGCVVKPVGGAGGSGATCGVRSVSDLARASLRATRIDPRLLIERQVPGDVYRLLFLDGSLIDTVRRRAPSVVGDGRSSITELIQRQNRDTLRAGGRPGASLLRVDLDCVLALRQAGWMVRSVPPAGTVVTVKGTVSQNAPSDNTTVREPLHPDLVAAALRAVECVGLRLAGVDVITTDPGVPLSVSGGAIVEVNGTPGLIYHERVADPAHATLVADPILRTLLGDD
jgi:D-alanine-D-alanine ligase-like ATP-grasp enzyme